MKNIRCAFGMLLCLALADTQAIPLFELRADDLLLQAPDLKKSLNLNPNQTLLWQQLEPKIRTMVRARQTRREKLQFELQRTMEDPKTELRKLAPKIDAEENSSLTENRQLREWLLSLNDALDDAQRQTMLRFLGDQLMRMPFADKEGRPARGPGEKGSEPHGRGKRGPGG
jgi:hypothetical protein